MTGATRPYTSVPAAEHKMLKWLKGGAPKKAGGAALREGSAVQQIEKIARAPPSLKTAHGVAYALRWQADGALTWEPAEHISVELLRAFESAWWSAARGEPSAPERLSDAVQRGPAVLPLASDPQGRTALHFACGRNDTDGALALLRCGAVVDSAESGQNGLTPLHIAAGYGSPDAVELLLQFGCDPDVEDSSGRSALDIVHSQLQRSDTAAGDELRRAEALLDHAMRMEERLVKVLDKRAKQQSAEDDGTFSEQSKGGEASASSSGSLNEGDAQTNLEYLVEFLDEDEPHEQWIDEDHVPDSAIEDFRGGVETAVAAGVLDRRQSENGKEEKVLLEWADGLEPSWEPASHVLFE